MIVTEPPHVLTDPGFHAGTGSGPHHQRPSPIRKRELSRFLALAIDAVGLRGKVSVLLTDDETIRGLNRQFRKINKPTDVLSFPAPEPAENLPERRRLAGDLAISLTTAARQANAFGHPLEMEVKILLLHGVLHLAGFDHETDKGEMAHKESALREKFGLPAGLIARSLETGPADVPSAKKKAARRSVRP